MQSIFKDSQFSFIFNYCNWRLEAEELSPVSRHQVLAYTLQGNSVFLLNLIGSSISEYPALLTYEEKKMASCFVSFKEKNYFE